MDISKFLFYILLLTRLCDFYSDNLRMKNIIFFLFLLKTYRLQFSQHYSNFRKDFHLLFAVKEDEIWPLYEPRHEKTNILHMRKQRRRSASR